MHPGTALQVPFLGRLRAQAQPLLLLLLSEGRQSAELSRSTSGFDVLATGPGGQPLVPVAGLSRSTAPQMLLGHQDLDSPSLCCCSTKHMAAPHRELCPPKEVCWKPSPRFPECDLI